MKTINNIKEIFVLRVILYIMITVVSATARELTDEEYSRLPQPFHLDDYHRCLSPRDGLYCVGTFHLTPAYQPHPTCELIKEYANIPGAYNRTLIRRGYCVSARCPPARALAPERNATLRFERCAAARARPHALHAALHTLHYCRTHHDNQLVPPPDTAQSVFIYVLYAILLLNTIGTTYDVITVNSNGKNKLLMAWSIPANWERLTIPLEAKDPRLSCLAVFQGARVVIMIIILYAHTVIAHVNLYLQNPRDMEEDIGGLTGVILANGTSLVQAFIMISSFLCSYNILLSSNKTPLRLSMLPKKLMKRIVRITPINLLVIGYGATWWMKARDGPLWPVLVGTEAAVCRRKFWTHALFINNFVEPKEYCYIHSWFLAVDMQLHIVALFLTLSLARLRRPALPILVALFLASCFFTSIIAYVKDYKSLIYITDTENLREIYRNEPSFQGLYISPLGSLPASMMGLIMASLQYKIQETGLKVSTYKWLVYSHNLFIPVYISWLVAGSYIREYTYPAVTAAYVGVERLVFSVLCVGQFIGACNIQSSMRRFWAWRGWNVFARMSLSVLMIHWCVTSIIVAARPHLTYTSTLDIGVDTAGIVVFTYFLAVPATVLVEIPMQRFMDNFIG